MEWFDGADAKQAAADALYKLAANPDEVVAWEWKSADGTHLLMLEHHC